MDFPYKKGEVEKIGGWGVLKKEGITDFTLIFLMSSFYVCLLLIYTISTSILCVSQERLSLN